MAIVMVSGIIVALIFPMLVLPATGVDKSKGIVLMSCISILPLTLIEYYFIRERITEEVADRSAQSIPLCQQLKEVLTGRYGVVITLYFLIYTFGCNIKNISGLPCAYVFAALTADVLDHLEWKYRHRVVWFLHIFLNRPDPLVRRAWGYFAFQQEEWGFSPTTAFQIAAK